MKHSTRLRAGNSGLYRLLGVVFLLVMAFQICFSYSAIQFRRSFPVEIQSPFQLALDSDRITSVNKQLADRGVRAGDRLLAIGGQPYSSETRLFRVLNSKRPGETIGIQVLKKGHSEPETVDAPLEALGSNSLSIFGWMIVASLSILTPAFCLLLGFGVAAIRPRDPLAWLLLALLLSFAQMSTAGGPVLRMLEEWPDGIRSVAIFYNVLVANTWPIWILLFGIYFPERFPLDRRWPWLKWLLLGPVAVHAIGLALQIAGNAENFRTFGFLPALIDPLGRITLFLGMAAVSCFFPALSIKAAHTVSPDARRRLILLMCGTSLSLTPLFLVELYILFTGHDQIPENVWIPCVLMLALFPITLAYVIVVQRALDVRVVIRQGLRYALAQGGVRVIQVAAITGVILAALLLATDPARNRPRKITAMALGVTAAFWIRRGSEGLRGWLDRRFFREAYNSEQILSDLSDQVRTMVETGPLLETVARQISGSLHVPQVAMIVKKNGHYSPTYALGYPAAPEIAFDAEAGTVSQLLRHREPLRVYFDDPDSWIYRDSGVQESERQSLHTLESQLLLPLAFKEKLIGFMSLSAKMSGEPYSKSDVQLLESVATQTGLALENSQLTQAIAVEVAQRERQNRELEIAREVQERLFPQSYPAIAGVDYAGRCRPALGVGGDYYDFLELEDGCLGIAIGDISGKGIPAALLMASLQASLRGQTISGSPDLAKLMTNVNRLIWETSPANRYATFFYGQYQPATRKLCYVNGGHNPPMIFRNDTVLRLEEGGPPVGLFKPARYSEASIQIEAGDVLVLYTDGISEAMNSADEEWEEDRMMDAVRLCREQPAIEMIDVLIRSADAFVAGAPQHDDMTVMVVKFL